MSATDNWCTPKWLTDLMPEVDLDPCSNAMSTVPARTKLEKGGLAAWPSQALSAYVNPPYSDPKPWVERAVEHAENFGDVLMLLKLDPTTQWFSLLYETNANFYPLRKRLTFAPGPGLAKGTTANFPSVLVEIYDYHQDSTHFTSMLTHLINERAIWSGLP